MAEADPFSELIRRMRAGDMEVAEQLWRRCEPALRREVRLRLRDPRLRRLVDETDICQSVMASFFVRACAGQYELSSPEDLQRLLVQMGRNKVSTQARRHQAERRDYRREEQLPEEGRAAASAQPSPSQAVAWEELLQKFRAGLDEEERQLADMRAEGRAWADIAALLGGSVDSRRVQLNRAIARVSRDLGLEGSDDD